MIFGSRPWGSIVSEGLVLSLDATNPASYSPGSTTWYDTSGFNNNGTLTNGPTYLQERGRGSVVFDGINDYVTGQSSSLFDFTVSYALKSSTVTSTLIYYPLGLNFSGSAAGGGIYFGGTFVSQTTGIFDGTNTVSSSISVLANTWYIITATRASNIGSIYVNGVLRSTGSISNSTILNYNVGRRTDAFWYYSGSISNVQIYNRALSQDEIQQNYNALKSRFNL